MTIHQPDPAFLSDPSPRPRHATMPPPGERLDGLHDLLALALRGETAPGLGLGHWIDWVEGTK